MRYRLWLRSSKENRIGHESGRLGYSFPNQHMYHIISLLKQSTELYVIAFIGVVLQLVFSGYPSQLQEPLFS
jgi:hypothetical protein